MDVTYDQPREPKEPTCKAPACEDCVATDDYNLFFGGSHEHSDECSSAADELRAGAGDSLAKKLEAGSCHHAGFENGQQVDEDEEESAARHSHGAMQKSLLTAIASGVINFLLMFGLCCAYGMIMFEDEWNARHRGLGVKMNLATAFIVGTILTCFSKVPVAIGGPDLNPTVFVGMLAQTIAKEIAGTHGLGDVYPSAGKACPGAPKLAFCEGGAFTSQDSIVPDDLADFADAASYAAACDAYHEELRATVMFTVSVTSALLGLILVILGRFKLTRFLSYIPTNIMEAFLACIGYKVFKYALKFCKYEPKQFLPAACVGVPLYFVKSLHIGNPAVVLPLMLLIPLGIYYAVVFGALGDDLEGMRKEKWMFDTLENADFWSVWTHGAYGSWDRVNLGAFASSTVDLPIMLIVCTLDCALKIFSTESKLPVKPDKEYEIQLYGAANVLTTLCGSPVGYMQLKFNVINYGVMGNAIDRRGGFLYASLCGLCFFWTTDPFNYLPRFFLSTLLFFAGAGFIAENLWGSRKFLSVYEWLQVLMIIALFIFSGSLLLAVILGGLIAAGFCVYNMAKVPAILGTSQDSAGRSSMLSIRRYPATDLACIQQASRYWNMVIQLKGFIFFGSAQAVHEAIVGQLKKGQARDKHARIRYIVLDLAMVDGLDASAAKYLSRITSAANEHNVRILWCGVNAAITLRLNASGTISREKDIMPDLGTALVHIERRVVSQQHSVQRTWLKLHPGFSLYRSLMQRRLAAEPFQDIFTSDGSRFGCPWKYCSKLELKRYQTVLWRPGESSSLYLVHTGAVGLFTSVPQDEDEEWGTLHATYHRGALINRGALGLEEASRFFAVALEDGEAIYWSQGQLQLMSQERPAMAASLQRAALSQETEDTRYERSGPYSISTPAHNTAPLPPTKRQTQVHWLPASLQRVKAGLDVARWLSDLGLYASSEPLSSEQPHLPEVVQEDLHIAFNTFCLANLTMRRQDAPAALAFAGLHDGVFCTSEDEEEEYMNEDEFIALGCECAMLLLSNAQVVRLRRLFVQMVGSDDPLARLQRPTLAQLFKRCAGQHEGACLEVLMGTVQVWAGEQDQGIDADTFVSIMARIARVHEKYWQVAKGFQEVLQSCGARDSEIAPSTTETSKCERIYPEMLVAASEDWTSPLDPSMAEEIVFLSNILQADNPGYMDLLSVAAFISSLYQPKVQALPPRPKLSGQRVPSKMLSEASVAVMGNYKAQMLQGGDQLSAINAIEGNRASLEEGANFSRPLGSISFTTASNSLGQEAAEEHTTCAAKLHVFLAEPESSRCAKIISLVMTMLIFASVVTLVVQPIMTDQDTERPKEATERMVWFVLDGFFTIAFSLEFILRFAVCNALGQQTRMGFLKQPLNIADMAAVVPWYIDLATMGNASASEFRLLRIARLLRLARLVRLGRLANKYAVVAPIAVILVVIWGIFLKNGLSSSC
jgi:MFS superfamily sulfate permease-like transporter/CRP-like cAMP-binding protein